MVQTLVDKESQESVSKSFNEALTGKEISCFNLPILSKSGKTYTLLLNACARRKSNGQVIGVLCLALDFTEINEKMVASTRVADDLTRVIKSIRGYKSELGVRQFGCQGFQSSSRY